MLFGTGEAFQEIAAQTIVKLGGRRRTIETRADDEVSDIGIGLEQDRRRKEHVVDANHAVLVQLHVVEERGAAVQREVQRVVKVVVQIRPGRDEKVDQPALHHLDDAAAEPGGRQRTGHGQSDRRVLRGIQHLFREDRARLGKPRGVERLKAFVDEMTNFLAAFWPVISNRLAGQDVGAGTGGTWRAIRHTWEIA
jgi:hypothetical protein